MLPISRKTSLWPMHPTLLNNPIQTPWKVRFPGCYFIMPFFGFLFVYRTPEAFLPGCFLLQSLFCIFCKACLTFRLWCAMLFMQS